jgi:hypothetical protein
LIDGTANLLPASSLLRKDARVGDAIVLEA